MTDSDRLAYRVVDVFTDRAFAGNPLADIRNAASVRMVMLGGKVHTLDDLLAPFRPDAATAQLPATHTLQALSSARHNHEYWWHEPEWAINICCGGDVALSNPARPRWVSTS